MSGSRKFCLVPNVPCGVESLLEEFLRATDVRISFLMYRVELKVAFFLRKPSAINLFLMYRVELKEEESKLSRIVDYLRDVPNVPCGVERGGGEGLQLYLSTTNVPNVPCGVESLSFPQRWAQGGNVPNVPCGVESSELPHNSLYGLCSS